MRQLHAKKLSSCQPVTLLQRAQAALTRHNTKLGLVALAVLLLLGSLWLRHRQQQQQVQQQMALFERGWQILEQGRDLEQAGDRATEPTSPKKADNPNQASKERVKTSQFASPAAAWRAARPLFATLLEQAGYGRLGILAAMLKADLDEKLEDFAAAELIYSALLQHLTPAEPLYFANAERLAFAQQRRGDSSAALATFELLAKDPKLFYAAEATYEQAQIHLQNNALASARERLEYLENTFPNSSLSDDVQTQLEWLKVRAAASKPESEPKSKVNKL